MIDVKETGWSILLNVVGGLLAGLIGYSANSVIISWRNRKFRHVFGNSKDLRHLAFASLKVGGVIAKAAATSKYNLQKLELPGMAFSAEYVASASDIRAAAYLSSSLGKLGFLASGFVSDDEISSQLDIDFISFGALSNLKSRDVFGNEANDLVHFHNRWIFANKEGHPVFPEGSGPFDYCVLLKIHPKQFQERTWITCAGLGEWGTSGGAWFLANKWQALSKEVKPSENFAALIKVEPRKDQSATLMWIAKTPKDVRTYPRSGGDASNCSATTTTN